MCVCVFDLFVVMEDLAVTLNALVTFASIVSFLSHTHTHIHTRIHMCVPVHTGLHPDEGAGHRQVERMDCTKKLSAY